MKTKEEVLKIIAECYYVDYEFDGEDEVGVDVLNKEMLADKIIESQRSYAKQQSIAFGDYLHANYAFQGNKWRDMRDGSDKTTAQVYAQFIEQQTTNK